MSQLTGGLSNKYMISYNKSSGGKYLVEWGVISSETSLRAPCFSSMFLRRLSFFHSYAYHLMVPNCGCYIFTQAHRRFKNRIWGVVRKLENTYTQSHTHTFSQKTNISYGTSRDFLLCFISLWLVKGKRKDRHLAVSAAILGSWFVCKEGRNGSKTKNKNPAIIMKNQAVGIAEAYKFIPLATSP